MGLRKATRKPIKVTTSLGQTLQAIHRIVSESVQEGRGAPTTIELDDSSYDEIALEHFRRCHAAGLFPQHLQNCVVWRAGRHDVLLKKAS